MWLFGGNWRPNQPARERKEEDFFDGIFDY